MKVWVAVAISVPALLTAPIRVAVGDTKAAAKASLMAEIGEDPFDRPDGLLYLPEPQDVEVVQEYKR